jgi:hypothetical protein
MKYLKSINEAFLKPDKRKAVNLIISYINKNSNIDLYEYDETWHIQKEELFLDGQLFIGLKSSKGVRINWLTSDFSSQIHSVDVWNDFKFESNPDFTINVKGLPISANLKKILSFIKDGINIKEELDTAGYDPREELKNAQSRLKRLKSEKSISLQKRKIEQLEAAIAFDEKAETDSTRIIQDDDLKIDVFKSIELYTIQVARGKSNSLIISGMSGVGKCHGKGTKILMYDGSIKNVEDVEIGEDIMGNDSTPRKVLSLGRGKDKIYEIKSKGWDTFTVNSEHILYIRNRESKNNKPIEISVKDFLKMGKSVQQRYQLIRTGVEFESKEIKMDPYLLGLWLGDGSRKSPFGIETCDAEIVDFLREKSLNYNLHLKLHKNKKSKSDGYYFSSGSKGKGLKLERNQFLNELKLYNLYNCDEKFIPKEYLLNNTNVRSKVLAGLIDSDGYQYNKSYSITTKWKLFAEQIVFLCRSLGFKSYITIKTINLKSYYNVNISGDLSDIPFKLQRKKSEKRIQRKNVLNSGFTISEIGYDNYYGFELDNNHLYLLGDFTITHNTQVVKDTLSSLGMKKDEHYYFATGTATTAGLYEVIFKNRHRLIVFDDCDSVFKDDESVNMLKGALDTYDVREIAKLSKGSIFDSTGMDDSEIQQKYEESGKLPNKFEFKGQVIFISNLPEEKFDDALLSRSLHVDVHLNKQELFDRMKDIMTNISPDVTMDKKEEALEYLTYVTEYYPTKFDLNLRTLIHSINLRANNEEKMKFGDREEFIWKLLIKKYLIKTK